MIRFQKRRTFFRDQRAWEIHDAMLLSNSPSTARLRAVPILPNTGLRMRARMICVVMSPDKKIYTYIERYSPAARFELHLTTTSRSLIHARWINRILKEPLRALMQILRFARKVMQNSWCNVHALHLAKHYIWYGNYRVTPFFAWFVCVCISCAWHQQRSTVKKWKIYYDVENKRFKNDRKNNE